MPWHWNVRANAVHDQREQQKHKSTTQVAELVRFLLFELR
jgi:hypothetical protein